MHKRSRYLLWIFTLSSLFLFQLVVTSAQSGNLLTNPGFESPYVSRSASPSGQSVANGWNVWHIPPSQGAPDFENLEPEYYEAVRADRIRSGNNAQRFESFFATHEGGVFQVVSDVGTEREVTFSVYAHVWSSGLDDESVSAEDGDVFLQVGIDPTGGTNGGSSEIVWSSAVEQYDAYRLYTVSAITEADTISVWVRSRVGFPVKTSRVYVDDASLIAEGESTAPTQPPTATTPPTTTTVPTTAPTATQAGGGSTNPTATQVNPTLPPTPTQFVPTPTQESTALPNTGGPATATPIPPTVAPISNTFPGRVSHTVQRGDTLAQLATRYGSTIEAIQQANGLGSGTLIFVGQSILIPVRLVPATSTPSATPLVIVVTATPVANNGTGGGTGGPLPVNVYIVQPGDTLSNIARRYNTSVAALAQLNGIVNPNSILVGQRLNITASSSPQPTLVPVATNAPVPTPAPVQTYVVQPGDNLYRISLRFNVSLAELIRINNIADANRVFVGQRLTLP